MYDGRGRIGVDFSNKIMIKIKSKSTSLFEKICLRHVTILPADRTDGHMNFGFLCVCPGDQKNI